jgi:hypothetical protein
MGAALVQCPEFLFWTYNVHSHILMSGTTTTVPLRYLPHSNRSHRYIDVASRPTPKIGMLWIARDRLSVAYRDVNGTTFPVAQPESAKLPWLIAEQGRGEGI